MNRRYLDGGGKATVGCSSRRKETQGGGGVVYVGVRVTCKC